MLDRITLWNWKTLYGAMCCMTNQESQQTNKHNLSCACMFACYLAVACLYAFSASIKNSPIKLVQLRTPKCTALHWLSDCAAKGIQTNAETPKNIFLSCISNGQRMQIQMHTYISHESMQQRHRMFVINTIYYTYARRKGRASCRKKSRKMNFWDGKPSINKVK